MTPTALGFGLSEGILSTAADLYGCEVEAAAQGLVVRLQVSARCLDGLKTRRRSLARRIGCGICGICSTECLDQMLRTVRPVAQAGRLHAGAVAQAMRAMGERQRLNQATGSAHAAAWCDSDGTIRLLREDVGRHNALDKRAGALVRRAAPQGAGFIAVTSRASVEMVQKAAVAGAPWLAAVSAPTALAVETASAAGMGLAGLMRGDDLVVYANPQGLSFDERQD